MEGKRINTASTTNKEDDEFMRRALDMARLAAEQGEVPVGAVAVADGEVLAASHNQVVLDNDPAGHAEMRVLRDAAQRLDNYRLPDVAVYVTLEPCAMCYGAMVHARIRRLVFGAPDPKSGVLGGAVDISEIPAFNHRMEICGGVLADDSAALLREFFRLRR